MKCGYCRWGVIQGCSIKHVIKDVGCCFKSLEIKMEPLSDFGDHMFLDEFIEDCKCGGFIDYDGFGYYATADQETDIEVVPSEIMEGKIDRR
jgi:hypothetical protein